MTAEIIRFPDQPLPPHVLRRRRIIEIHKEMILDKHDGKLPDGFDLEREAEQKLEEFMPAFLARRHGPAG